MRRRPTRCRAHAIASGAATRAALGDALRALAALVRATPMLLLGDAQAASRRAQARRRRRCVAGRIISISTRLIAFGSGDAVRTMGVGFSPGDEYYDEPYFYVGLHPAPDVATLAAAAGDRALACARLHRRGRDRRARSWRRRIRRREIEAISHGRDGDRDQGAGLSALHAASDRPHAEDAIAAPRDRRISWARPRCGAISKHREVGFTRLARLQYSRSRASPRSGPPHPSRRAHASSAAFVRCAGRRSSG